MSVGWTQCNGYLWSWVVIPLIFGCASPDGPTSRGGDVLENVDAAAPTTSPAPSSPAHERLMELLRSLGYEGVGLQFETESSLDRLFKVFSDPRAKNRQIKLVYTGLKMAYDSTYQSLTIGGASDLQAILGYIERNVPKKSIDRPQ